MKKTRAFVALENYEPLLASVGDQLLQSEESAQELAMDFLIARGIFKEQTESEAIEYFKKRAKEKN